MSDANWARARNAIHEYADSDGYADALRIEVEFGGEAANFGPGSGSLLLERFNAEYNPQLNSFERHPRNPTRWRNT